MTQAEFDKLLAARFDTIRKVLASKSVEYSTGRDKLHNFKRASEITGNVRSPEQVCMGFMLKHITSLADLVDARAADPECNGQGLFDEKLGDAINYLILLEALWKEGQ